MVHLVSTKTAHDDRSRYVIQYFRGMDFVVGMDNRLVSFLKLVTQNQSRFRLPHVDDVKIEHVVNCGLMGFVHIVDVRADDPSNYFFDVHGLSTYFANGKESHGLRVGAIPIPLFRDLAISDYAISKRERGPALAQFLAAVGTDRVQYRRLIVPLFDDRREVTHLLVTLTKDFFEVPGCSDYEFVTAGLDAVKPLVTASREEVARYG